MRAFTRARATAALMAAAIAGGENGVKVLLDYGADPATTDNAGRTARAWAEQRGQQAIVDLLASAED